MMLFTFGASEVARLLAMCASEPEQAAVHALGVRPRRAHDEAMVPPATSSLTRSIMCHSPGSISEDGWESRPVMQLAVVRPQLNRPLGLRCATATATAT